MHAHGNTTVPDDHVKFTRLWSTLLCISDPYPSDADDDNHPGSSIILEDLITLQTTGLVLTSWTSVFSVIPIVRDDMGMDLHSIRYR